RAELIFCQGPAAAEALAAELAAALAAGRRVGVLALDAEVDALAQAGDLQGKAVLDFGCGSGILALAALKLGAARATGIDNDPQAITATADNAERNGVEIATFLPQDAPAGRYPVVVANILASALDALAETLAARTASGGRLAMSGILAGQEQALLVRFAPWFDALQVAREDDWVRLDGIRNQAAVAA
ncbi:MAG: 50S ribosomal protein L11 methyltransferase, partial [Thermomonas sp.]